MSLAAFSPFVNGSCAATEPVTMVHGTPSDTAAIVIAAVCLFFDALLVGYVYWNRSYVPFKVKQPSVQVMQIFGK